MSIWMPILYLMSPYPEGAWMIALSASWCAFGASSALMMFVCLMHMSTMKKSDSMQTLGLAASIGACFYMIISGSSGAYAQLAVLLMFMLSAIFFIIGKPNAPVSFDDEELRQASQSRLSDGWDAIKASLRYQPGQPFFGMLFGLGIGTGISMSVYSSGGFPLAISIAFCLAGPLLLILSFMPKAISTEKIEWVLMPTVAFGLLPLVLAIDAVSAICCSLLAFCYSLFALVHFISLEELMYEIPSQRPSIASSGLCLMYGGACIGWLISYLFLLMQAYNSKSFFAVIIFVVLVMTCVVSYVGRPSTRASGNMILTKPIGKTRDEWEAACTSVIEQAGLSPRQAEIFMFLAKGRNAAFIEEELVVSYHTVKAHIYRIYQKLDVHSQQELINKVEEQLTQ